MIEVANCGTIPVKLDKVELIDLDPPTDPDCLVHHMNLVYYKIEFPDGTVIEKWDPNASLTQLEADLDHVQIEPCERLKITLAMHLLQSAPEGATTTFEIAVTFTQWNMVP